jgi:hypothetical protein
MLDDDDLDFAILAGSCGGGSGGGKRGAGDVLLPILLFLGVIVFLAYLVGRNHQKCRAMTCPNKGEVSQLMNHQCLCVTPAIAPTPTDN